jgi:hypothetical protein
MLVSEASEGAIKNGHPEKLATFGYPRQRRTKQKTKHRKLKR